jgi:hypothetical protein
MDGAKRVSETSQVKRVVTSMRRVLDMRPSGLVSREGRQVGAQASQVHGEVFGEVGEAVGESSRCTIDDPMCDDSGDFSPFSSSHTVFLPILLRLLRGEEGSTNGDDLPLRNTVTSS